MAGHASNKNSVVTYTRKDGSILRAKLEPRPEGTYAIDLRAFHMGRPTLKAPGDLRGTKSLGEAKQYALRELEAIDRGMAAGTPSARVGPQTQVQAYIEQRRSIGGMTTETAAAAYTCIIRMWAFFHDAYQFTAWRQVDREHIAPLVTHLFTAEFKGRRLKRNTVLKHLNYTKGFFTWCVDAGIVKASPLKEHSSVPKPDHSFQREWLEPNEVNDLLTAAFAGRKNYPHNACHAWPEILATQAYTGARENEVLGLMVADVSLVGGDRGAGVIHFRHNGYRKLKNDESERVFSMWRAHARILRAYLAKAKPRQDGLLFPGRNGAMWKELREAMARDLKEAGITKQITDHSMRHSYISARSRMFAPRRQGNKTVYFATDPAVTAKEVGHGSDRMTREVYTHASQHPAEDFTDLDYATAARVFKNGLRNPPAGRAASARAKRSTSRR